MGGRKFRLSTHRKNEERKRGGEKADKLSQQLSLIVAIPCQLVTIPNLIVSLPIESYLGGHVQSSAALSSRLTSLPLPSSWIIASTDPLTLCKLRVQQEGQVSRADLTTTVSISSELGWTVSFTGKELTPTGCPLLAKLPCELTSATAVCHLISLLDSAKLCTGNSDEKFLKLWHHRALTLHGSQNPIPGVLDSSTGACTIRNGDCQLLLPEDSTSVRCPACSTHRSTLCVQSQRLEKRISTPSHDSHVNHRYHSLPDLVSRLTDMHHQYRLVSKQCDRLKKKIAAVSEVVGVSLDEETHEDLKILTSESMKFLEELPLGTIFWMSAAARWRP